MLTLRFHLLPPTVFVMLVTALLAGCAGGGLGPPRAVVVPAGAPANLPYSPGVRVGDIIYVSGQVAGEPTDIAGQTTGVLKKVQSIIESAGGTMTNVDKCTVFLTRQADFAPMNEVWRSFFPTNPPARSTIIVAALPQPEFLIELDCIAHK
jgi:2-iminobutanoate/2-iminopropanoate deaminase